LKSFQRKAQINQVFTYLIIILVVGLVVIFGYKGIKWILDAKCEEQRITFERNLLDFIDQYSNKGTTQEKVLRAPCGVVAVCFIDSQYYTSDVSLPSLSDTVMASSLEDKTHNIFVRSEFTEPIGLSHKIALRSEDLPFKCFNATKEGKFTFVFRGLGRKTQIESS
jgi:hypothetical protein